MGAPLVSVIIPTYRGRELLCEAVRSALAQTVRDIEIIVVEDGTRTASDALRGWGDAVKYIWQENQGVSVARNTAVSHARGQWLAFLDHDDLWLPEKLERQLLTAERWPELELIHTDHFVLRGSDRLPGPRLVPTAQVPSGHVLHELFQNNFIVQSSALLTKTACVSAGGFDRRHVYAQDYDLWLRVARRHKVGFVAERLTVFRDHDSLGSDHARALVDCAEVLAAFVRANPDVWNDVGGTVVRARMATAYWEAAYAHFGEGAYAIARPLFMSAMRWGKPRLRPLVYGLACLTGPAGVRMARAVKATLS